MRIAIGAIALLALGASPFRPCLDAVERAPDSADGYYCFVQVAQATARHAEAARHLERFVAERPDAGRIRLDLAVVAAALGRPDADALYGRAIEDMVGAGDDRGAVFGLSALAGRRTEQGAIVEAEELLDRATARALAAGDPELTANARYRRAQLALSLADYGRARRELLAAYDLVEPDGPRYLRAWVHGGLGLLHWSLDEPEAALRAFERQRELVRGHVAEEPGVLHDIVLAVSALRDLGRRTDADVEAALREALAAARAAGDRTTEAALRLLLVPRLEGEAALAELREIEPLVRGDLDLELLALRARAERIAIAGDLPSALELLDEARRRAEDAGDPFHAARAEVLRAGLIAWDGGDWVAAFERALLAVERIRTLQPEARTGELAASSWSYVYRLYTALLLERFSQDGDAEDLARAFATTERLRGAAGRERLWRGTDTSARATELRPIERRLREVLGEIVRLQRRAGPAGASAAGRDAAAELARLEREEIRLRDARARLGPPLAAPSPVGLEELRGALRPDEALIAFQVEPHRGSRYWPDVRRDWAIVVTRDDAWADPLPGSGPEWAARIEVYRGLLANRDGSEVAAAVRLHRELVGGAYDRLSPTIGRWIVVPDGALASLPLETLRAAPDAPPLGLRRAVTYAPSATSWVRARERAAGPLPRAALVFADPTDSVVARAGADAVDDPGAAEREDVLAPLPWARVEGRDVVRALSGRLLEGAAASERALKREDLARFGLIHFGAHAVVSDAAPRRTAILLAPGADDEDGFLQLREIVELPLDGRIVFLAACRSADGRRVDGAGVLGLADAFLRAGAAAVIGTLWPVRDEETSRMTVELAQRLAAGATVADAAREARRRLHREGRPAGAWGGIVVLGDGEARLTPGPAGGPGGSGDVPASLRLAGIGALLALILVAILLARRALPAR